MYNHFFKRIFDLLIAIIAAIVLLPVMLIVMLLLRLTGHKRIFFVQKRVGRNNRIFHLIKFRSMTEATDASGKLLPDDIRLTSFGKTLRKTSLDELPQLINVIKGDMSIIGPRPLLVEYLPLYNEEQKKRHLVRPGITGWAQVNGRNAISWEQKFEYDVWYVNNQSFALDVKIFFLTIKNIVKAEGISQDGQATMKAFTGSK
ncbi:MAG: sugar transferase [Bacteroidetes bacterium]|nr:sugar transferase [Bacteroidota bacterium]